MVLVAEVEASLAQIKFRDDQSAAPAEALASARRAAELARARYEAGTGTYLEVLDTDRTLLQQQRREAQLLGQRFSTSALLIKALGGGWQKQEASAADANGND